MMINETLHRHWRDWLALCYIAICVFDFMVGATWWNLSIREMFNECLVKYDQAICYANLPPMWQPYTLQNGGMFHIAMGAILGAAAWKRADETT
jgi:hypothetical protein